MGNCLVTKLNGSVSGELPKFGTIHLHSYPVDNSNNRKIALKGAGAVISTEGTGHTFNIDDYSSIQRTTFTLPDDNFYFPVFESGDYDIEIKNKYALIFLGSTESYTCNVLPKNIGELAYTNLTGFRFRCNVPNAIEGDLSVFRDFGHNITKFTISDQVQSGVTGNLSDFANLSNDLDLLILNGVRLDGNISVVSKYKKLETFSPIGGIGLTGNIESLGSLTKLKNFLNSVFLPNTGIHGSIDAFVEAQCNAETPRTSYFFDEIMNGILNSCTFNGAIRSSHGWGWLGWESASKIYVLDGANNRSGCPYVTCKGYTQAEAEAKWPGKTIIRVDA